jgi:hypothetical protein
MLNVESWLTSTVKLTRGAIHEDRDSSSGFSGWWLSCGAGFFYTTLRPMGRMLKNNAPRRPHSFDRGLTMLQAVRTVTDQE